MHFQCYAETETNATGWRINGTYEFNPQSSKVAHGLSFGIISTSATGTSGYEYDLRSWPLYCAPKVMFGENKIRAFIKGALGLHFSHYGGTGNAIDLDTNDTGFYGGASAGTMVYLKENIFLNAEYEWAYMSNSFYQNGMMNSAMLGLEFKF